MQINIDAQTKASALSIPIEWAEAFYLLRDANRPKRIEKKPMVRCSLLLNGIIRRPARDIESYNCQRLGIA